MKILIVAFRFPPSNLIGAVRVGKLGRYLHHKGYDVRVLTTDISEDRSLPVEIPRKCIVLTRFPERQTSVERPIRPVRTMSGSVAGTARPPVVLHSPLTQSITHKLRKHYYGLVHIPDQRIAWIRSAIPAARQLIQEWKPDIIFASAPPYTGLIVASRLSREFDIPWVADLRDLWADNPYFNFPAWRRPIDRMLERFTLRNVSAIVTTSPHFAKLLRSLHHKRVEVVFNGYAEEDFPHTSCEHGATSSLIIRYTGTIYQGYRDPSPLFGAIALLEREIRSQIRVEFFGESGTDITELAAKYRIVDQIEVRASVPYRAALELQLQADVLLLLHWNDKRDEGTVPGKLFEYLYARRPILYIGYEHGIAAEFIRERGAGLISNSAERIREQLRAWVEDKRAGRLTRLDQSVSRGLSRDEQFRKVEPIFADILDRRRV
jgi:glycosyltransferase involved in cell wall biosynthesis